MTNTGPVGLADFPWGKKFFFFNNTIAETTYKFVKVHDSPTFLGHTHNYKNP
jgi:hypothetical protein